MPGFSDYSATPAANTTCAGLSIAEGTTAVASVNDVARQILAEGRQLRDTVVGLGSPMPLTGGAFTGNVTRSGFGGFLGANDPTFAAPRYYFVVDGGPAPIGAPIGSIVIYHAA